MSNLKKVFAGMAIFAIMFSFGIIHAHATSNIKVIIDNTTFTGNFVATSVHYFDPNINSEIDTQSFQVYLGNSGGLFTDDPTFTSEGIQSGLKSQILSYAVAHSYTMNSGDIIWETMSTLSADTLLALKTGMPVYWHNGVLQTSLKHITFSGTTTGGSKVFYLTDDGTVTGNALCSSTPKFVSASVNDPSNTFGLGWAVTNSNKTLTITANVRSFSSTTILGISVLGSSSLAAAANGTAINVLVDCN